MIETKNLAVGYGDEVILKDLSLTFEPGKLTVLLGPNGSGKSTLIRSMLGLQDIISGQILCDGEPIQRLSGRELAQKLAYMAQSRPTPNISAKRMVLHGRFPHLSYPRRYREEDYSAAMEAMKRTDSYDLANCYVPQLSGGQRQKVYLAMALAQDTQTIMMDEPTTYLDVEHQLQVMELARSLAREGRAVVMVLHDLCMAMRYADHIVLLHDGSLRSQGSPEEIFASGLMDQVFKVKLSRIETAGGWQYYYELAAPERG